MRISFATIPVFLSTLIGRTVFTSETFRLYLVSSFCSCLAVRKAYAY